MWLKGRHPRNGLNKVIPKRWENTQVYVIDKADRRGQAEVVFIVLTKFGVPFHEYVITLIPVKSQ